MPYIIPGSQFKEIIDGKRKEITLTQVPIERLKECVGFTYRWLNAPNAAVKVTYLPSNNIVETGINANLTVLKACVERNPSEYYWIDCICVPQDPKLSALQDVELSNMRNYYSNFKRVSFIGHTHKLSPHDGHFEMKHVKDLYCKATDKEIQEIKNKKSDDEELAIIQLGFVEPKFKLTPSGINAFQSLRESCDQKLFILNEYETRAWTFQETVVAKEIEFMGLHGTSEEFFNLIAAIVWDVEDHGEVIDSITDIFVSYRFLKNGLNDKFSAGIFFQILSERMATKPEDMFYAILPVFDGSVVGKKHLEMWDAIRVKSQTLLLDFIQDLGGNYVAHFVDPYWFGINNINLLRYLVKPKKMNACFFSDYEMLMNWTIGDRKVNVTFRTEEKFRREGNTIYFDETSVSFKEGHEKETNEWKEYLFVPVPDNQ